MKKVHLVIFFCIYFIPLIAQQEHHQHMTISVAIFNENFGLVPIPQGNALHLGGAIAVTFVKKQNGVYRKFNNIELGYFKHESVFQAAYLAWKPQYEWQFHKGFQLHGITGLGYLHALPSQTTFEQNDGIYEATTNLGKAGGIASLGVGLGFQFDNNHPVTLFVRQEIVMIAPFSINESLPLSIHSSLKLGITIPLF